MAASLYWAAGALAGLADGVRACVVPQLPGGEAALKALGLESSDLKSPRRSHLNGAANGRVLNKVKSFPVDDVAEDDLGDAPLPIMSTPSRRGAPPRVPKLKLSPGGGARSDVAGGETGRLTESAVRPFQAAYEAERAAVGGPASSRRSDHDALTVASTTNRYTYGLGAVGSVTTPRSEAASEGGALAGEQRRRGGLFRGLRRKGSPPKGPSTELVR